MSTTTYAQPAAATSFFAATCVSGNGPQADALALQAVLADGERLLATLAPPGRRSGQERTTAELVHAQCREWRRRFMQDHAAWVYDCLTAGRTLRLRIGALALAAARMFPGLVPTEAQLENERTLFQGDKEGREIDQGIFFAALLADRGCGAHLVDSMLQPSVRARAYAADFRRDGRIALDTLLLERRGPVAHLTVCNREHLNAEDNTLIDDMETAVDLVLLDDASRVGVLRGGAVAHPKYAGRRVFSAGINLKHLHRGQISFVDFLLRRELGYIHKIWRGLLEHDTDGRPVRRDKPWIAAVDSFAIGGGAQLLLVFDHVIAASDSFFSLPAAQEGIVPGVANLRLTRALGTRLARQVILGGRAIRAADPEAALVFDRIVAPEAMDAEIERAAGEYDNAAVTANRRMLNMAEESSDMFRSYMAEFAAEQALRLYSPDVIGKLQHR